MKNDDMTRRVALGGMIGAVAVPHVATAAPVREGGPHTSEVKRVFIDLALADAEAATTEGQLFQLVDTVAGTAAIYRRSAVGADKLYEDLTAAALRKPEGSANVGFDNDTVGTRLNILSATMRPAMRGIFSDRGDQRVALLEFINEAAAGGKTIEWGPIDISLDVESKTNGNRGLVVPSGSRWVMHPDTRIRALPNGATHYEIINIIDGEDISIEGNGARIVGERDDHAGDLGQSGMGVGMRGARNVRIRDLITENCWGDGFYVGSGRRNYCQDIILKNTKSIRARRNGLSLISARGFLCEDHESINTSGHAPEWGVDIEPNTPNEYLEDVTFLRTATKASGKTGFGIFLGAFEGSSNPVSIRLIDCVDVGSAIGFAVGSARNVGGRIDIIRPKSNRARTTGISLRRKAVSGPHVSIREPVVIDWNRDQVSVTAAKAAINIFAPGEDGGTEALGNVDIVNPDIRLTDKQAEVGVAIFVMDQRRTHPAPPVGVRIIDPLNLAGLPVWLGAESVTFQDRNRVSERVLPDADTSINAASMFLHNVINVTAPRNYRLASTLPIGVELVFEVASPVDGGRIILQDGEQLYPDNVEKGRFILSTVKGARLRLRKTGSREWMIVDKIGIWKTG